MKINSIDDVALNSEKKKTPSKISKLLSSVIFCTAILLGGCPQPSPPNPDPKTYDSWHYQLQNAKYSNLKSLSVDALVVDLDDVKFNKPEIQNLTEEKVVLSYLSIGAAENYRDYWQSDWRTGNPSFVDEELSDWANNYYVKYWDSEWQNIMLEKVKNIAELGYSGIYLDMIDAYYHYQENGRPAAAEEMIDFVRQVKDVGRSINPNFLIVPQNAPELYEYPEYKDLVDGFGKESTWYIENSIKPSEDRDYELSFLDKAIKDGKFVLAIDYPTVDDYIKDFYNKCTIHGFAGTVSNRDLSLGSPMH